METLHYVLIAVLLFVVFDSLTQQVPAPMPMPVPEEAVVVPEEEATEEEVKEGFHYGYFHPRHRFGPWRYRYGWRWPYYRRWWGYRYPYRYWW